MGNKDTVWTFKKPSLNAVERITVDGKEYAVAMFNDWFHVYVNGMIVFKNKSFNRILKELDSMDINYKLI